MRKTMMTGLLVAGMLGSAFAQDFRGKAVYESKTYVDMDLQGTDIPEQDRKRMLERMKQDLEKTFILDFTRTTSLYQEEEQLGQPIAERGGMRMAVFTGPGGEGIYYKDVKNLTYCNQVEVFGKIFRIKDSLPDLQWKLDNETRKIGEYTCYKATAIRKVSRPGFSVKPGKGNKREKTADSGKEPVGAEDKKIVITAWYTPEIPVNQGPGEYWGLPGLILGVDTERTSILCSKIILNSQDKEEIEAPKKGKEVSRAEFDEIMHKKMEEMREMHRREGRNRDGGRVFRIGG
ncbi:GLPGLI family protein [Sinomicrobium pectinilyticum]|uniref:GLPGLI family protein n=1 Tax=Sinomicrobium pectinilyticum TaxID=1084421 RepID=A0A3N0EDQ7_SINP1|nr:GLPGLI family protein [Sinomicrobium pectinilyticum]RNL85990.1 GLPGLI family protein [Sinomicrobium pectinilyticum]